jgi:hypothetical protein
MSAPPTAMTVSNSTADAEAGGRIAFACAPDLFPDLTDAAIDGATHTMWSSAACAGRTRATEWSAICQLIEDRKYVNHRLMPREPRS